MAYIILTFAVVIFSVIGIIECIKGIIFRLYRSHNDKTIMLISPAFGHCEDIEYTLRSCAIKTRWMGKVRPTKVICLDEGMDNPTKQICDLVCSEYEFMEVMDRESLLTFLDNNQ